MVTKAIDSIGVTKPLVTAHSTVLKVLRFDIDPRIALFFGNSSDLQRLRQRGREECSKRSSESASYVTAE